MPIRALTLLVEIHSDVNNIKVQEVSSSKDDAFIPTGRPTTTTTKNARSVIDCVRELLKKLIRLWPWPLTVNERYDRQTKSIIKKVCQPNSICIDVGCYKGEILEWMIASAPHAKHIAFEPIPDQYQFLVRQFNDNADVYPYALGNTNHQTTFQHVVSNPTYSGLRQRQYKGEENIREIKVEVRRLDDVIPSTIPVRLIKIDVEGGELDVLKGAEQMLRTQKPYLVFEHGLGGADKYGTGPEDIYRLLVDDHHYRICLMHEFLNGKKTGFALNEFEEQFLKKLNCYFIAVPEMN